MKGEIRCDQCRRGGITPVRIGLRLFDRDFIRAGGNPLCLSALVFVERGCFGTVESLRRSRKTGHKDEHIRKQICEHSHTSAGRALYIPGANKRAQSRLSFLRQAGYVSMHRPGMDSNPRHNTQARFIYACRTMMSRKIFYTGSVICSVYGMNLVRTPCYQEHVYPYSCN